MKILQATACGRMPASSYFFDCFYGTNLPEGSVRKRVIGPNYSLNMNILIDAAIEGEFDYIFYVDDDFLFHPDTAMRLLAHNKDCCGALLTERLAPFRACIFNYMDKDGKLGHYILKNEKGLLGPVLGTGGLPNLTRVDIFKKLTKPYYPDDCTIGDTRWGGDILFAKKLIDAGIPCYVDLDTQIWHAGMYSVAMCYKDDQWKNVININGTLIPLKQDSPQPVLV